MAAGWMPDQVFDYVYLPLQEQLEPLAERLAALEERTRQFDEMQEKMRRFEEMEAKLLRLEGVEAQMKQVQASLQKALDTFMPRVEQLLLRMEVKEAPRATRPTVPTAPCSHIPTVSLQQTPQQMPQGPLSLLEAAKGGKVNIIRQLLRRGANIHQEDAGCETALMHAVRGGHLEAAQVLVQAGANVEAYNEPRLESSLILAASAGNEAIVELLLCHGANLEVEDVEGNTAIWHAASKGHTNIVELLLNTGAFVDFGDPCEAPCTTTLEVAAQQGHAKTVTTILTKRNDWIDEDLEEALSITDSPAVVWAIARIAPHDFWGQAGGRAVMNATRNGRSDALEAMLQAGASTNYRNLNGLTPLHVASSYENTAAMLSLLLHEADTDARDNKGRSPLHLATIHGRAKAVRVLLAKNADRNAADKRGRTPADATNNEDIRIILGCSTST